MEDGTVDESTTLHCKYQLTGHVKPIVAYAYSHRRHHILTADSQTLRLWSLRKELRRVSLPTDTNLTARVLLLAHSGVEDVFLLVHAGEPRKLPASVCPGVVKVYYPSLAELIKFKAHKTEIVGASWCDGAQTLVTSAVDGCVKVWALSRADNKLRISESNVIMVETDVATNVLSFNLPGTLLFGAAGTRFMVWHMETGKMLRQVNDMASRPTTVNADPARRGRRKNVKAPITAMLYVDDTEHVAMGYADGFVTVWNVAGLLDGGEAQPPTLVRRFAAHRGRVVSLRHSFTNRSFPLYTLGADNVVRHWNVATGTEDGRHKLQTRIDRLVFNNQGLRRPSGLEVLNLELPKCRMQLILAFGGGVISVLQLHAQQVVVAECDDRVLMLRPAVARQDGSLQGETGQAGDGGEEGEGEEDFGLNRNAVVALSGNSKLQIIDPYEAQTVRSIEPRTRRNPGIYQLSTTSSFHTSRRGSVTANQLLSQSASLSEASNAGWGPNYGVSARVVSYGVSELQGALPIGWNDGTIDVVNGLGERLARVADPSMPVPVTCVTLVNMRPPLAADRPFPDSLDLPPVGPTPEQAAAGAAVMAGLPIVSDVGLPRPTVFRSKDADGHEYDEYDEYEEGEEEDEAGGAGGGGGLEASQHGQQTLPPGFAATEGNVELQDSMSVADTHTAIEKCYLLSGTSEGALHIWSLRPKDAERPRLRSVTGHSDCIVAISHLPLEDEQLPPAVTRGVPLLPPTVGVIVSASRDGVVKVWDQVTFKLLGFFVARGNVISAMQLPPGSGTVVLGYDSGGLESWQMPFDSVSQLAAAAPRVGTLHHLNRITAIACSPNWDELVSVGMDHALTVSHPVTLEPLLRLAFTAPVIACCYDPDPDFVVVAVGSKVLRVCVREDMPTEFEDGEEIIEPEPEEQRPPLGTQPAYEDRRLTAPRSPPAPTAFTRSRPLTSVHNVDSWAGLPPPDDPHAGVEATARGMHLRLTGEGGDDEGDSSLTTTVLGTPKGLASGRTFSATLETPPSVSLESKTGDAVPGQCARGGQINLRSPTAGFSRGGGFSRSLSALSSVEDVEEIQGQLQEQASQHIETGSVTSADSFLSGGFSHQGGESQLLADPDLQALFQSYDPQNRGRIWAQDLPSLLNEYMVGKEAADLVPVSALPPEVSRAMKGAVELSLSDVAHLVELRSLSQSQSGTSSVRDQLGNYWEMRQERTAVEFNQMGEARRVPVSVRTDEPLAMTKEELKRSLVRQRQMPVTAMRRHARMTQEIYGQDKAGVAAGKWWSGKLLTAIPAPIARVWRAELGGVPNLQTIRTIETQKILCNCGMLIAADSAFCGRCGNGKESTTVFGQPPLSQRPLIRELRRLRGVKRESDVFQDANGLERFSFSFTVYEHYKQLYGVGRVARRAVMRLCDSLVEHREFPICYTFAAFLGVAQPDSGSLADDDDVIAREPLDLYLDSLYWLKEHDMIVAGDPVGDVGADLRWELVRLESCFQCARAVLGALEPEVAPRTLRRVLEKLPLLGVQSDEELQQGASALGLMDTNALVQLDAFLALIVDEWAAASAASADAARTLFLEAGELHNGKADEALEQLHGFFDAFLPFDWRREGVVDEASFREVIRVQGQQMWPASLTLETLDAVVAAFQVPSHPSEPSTVAYIDLFGLLFVEVTEAAELPGFSIISGLSKKFHPAIQSSHRQAIGVYLESSHVRRSGAVTATRPNTSASLMAPAEGSGPSASLKQGALDLRQTRVPEEQVTQIMRDQLRERQHPLRPNTEKVEAAIPGSSHGRRAMSATTDEASALLRVSAPPVRTVRTDVTPIEQTHAQIASSITHLNATASASPDRRDLLSTAGSSTAMAGGGGGVSLEGSAWDAPSIVSTELGQISDEDMMLLQSMSGSLTSTSVGSVDDKGRPTGEVRPPVKWEKPFMALTDLRKTQQLLDKHRDRDVLTALAAGVRYVPGSAQAIAQETALSQSQRVPRTASTLNAVKSKAARMERQKQKQDAAKLLRSLQVRDRVLTASPMNAQRTQTAPAFADSPSTPTPSLVLRRDVKQSSASSHLIRFPGVDPAASRVKAPAREPSPVRQRWLTVSKPEVPDKVGQGGSRRATTSRVMMEAKAAASRRASTAHGAANSRKPSMVVASTRRKKGGAKKGGGKKKVKQTIRIPAGDESASETESPTNKKKKKKKTKTKKTGGAKKKGAAKKQGKKADLLREEASITESESFFSGEESSVITEESSTLSEVEERAAEQERTDRMMAKVAELRAKKKAEQDAARAAAEADDDGSEDSFDYEAEAAAIQEEQRLAREEEDRLEAIREEEERARLEKERLEALAAAAEEESEEEESSEEEEESEEDEEDEEDEDEDEDEEEDEEEEDEHELFVPVTEESSMRSSVGPLDSPASATHQPSDVIGAIDDRLFSLESTDVVVGDAAARPDRVALIGSSDEDDADAEDNSGWEKARQRLAVVRLVPRRHKDRDVEEEDLSRFDTIQSLDLAEVEQRRLAARRRRTHAQQDRDDAVASRTLANYRARQEDDAEDADGSGVASLVEQKRLRHELTKQSALMSFADDITFKPFELVAKPGRRNWRPNAKAHEQDEQESDVSDSDEELEEARKAKDKAKNPDVSFLYEIAQNMEYLEWPHMATKAEIPWENFFEDREKELFENTSFDAEEWETALYGPKDTAPRWHGSPDDWAMLGEASSSTRQGSTASESASRQQAREERTKVREGVANGTLPVTRLVPGTLYDTEVAADEYRYYYVDVADPHSIVTVSVHVATGDHTLMMNATTLPSALDARWTATATAEDSSPTARVVIYPTSAGHTVGRFFVAVRGGLEGGTYAISTILSTNPQEQSEAMQRVETLIARFRVTKSRRDHLTSSAAEEGDGAATGGLEARYRTNKDVQKALAAGVAAAVPSAGAPAPAAEEEAPAAEEEPPAAADVGIATPGASSRKSRKLLEERRKQREAVAAVVKRDTVEEAVKFNDLLVRLGKKEMARAEAEEAEEEGEDAAESDAEVGLNDAVSEVSAVELEDMRSSLAAIPSVLARAKSQASLASQSGGDDDEQEEAPTSASHSHRDFLRAALDAKCREVLRADLDAKAAVQVRRPRKRRLLKDVKQVKPPQQYTLRKMDRSWARLVKGQSTGALLG